MKTWQDKEEFKRLFTEKAYRLWEKELQELTLNEVYQTIAYMIRDLVSEDWIRTNQSYAAKKVKQVYYFSIEFLMGRLLESNLLNVDMDNICRDGLKDLGWDLEEVIPAERDPGLGNGDSAGWQPVLSTLWPPCPFPVTATASVISMASLTSASSITSRSSCPITGWSKAILGKSRKSTRPSTSVLAAMPICGLPVTAVSNVFTNSSRRSRPFRMTCRSSASKTIRSTPSLVAGRVLPGKKCIRNWPRGTVTGPSATKTASSRFLVFLYPR